jgi:PAS domain S-box-containing protein
MKETTYINESELSDFKIENEAIERLAAIVTGSDDVIIGKDLKGIITSWNIGAEKTLGYTAKEAIGKTIDFILAPGTSEEETLMLAKILKGERIEHFEIERVCKDGRRITLSTNVSPIFDSKGNVVGVSRIARDITQQNKTLKSLQEAN